jgi:hypothetical protein
MASRDEASGPAAAGWHEWVITTSVVLLSLGAVWAVFGDDLAQLVSPAPPNAENRSESSQRGPSLRR